MFHWHRGSIATKYFILCIARARPCFNCFKELTHEYLVNAYLFQSITHPSTSSSWVRRLWMISYKNASVCRLILVELPCICHLVYNTVFISYMLYCNIALQTCFQCYIANIALIFPLILPRKILYYLSIYLYIYIYM